MSGSIEIDDEQRQWGKLLGISVEKRRNIYDGSSVRGKKRIKLLRRWRKRRRTPAPSI